VRWALATGLPGQVRWLRANSLLARLRGCLASALVGRLRWFVVNALVGRLRVFGANALLGLGALLLVYAGLWQFGLAPGSRVSLPEPVALAKAPPLPLGEVDVAEPREATAGEGAVQPLPVASAPNRPSPAVPNRVLIAPDAADRAAAAAYPAPGYAVRLAIPSIKLDTEVKQGGIVADADANPTWQTLPFVAVHYGDLTSLVGARGNAVIAGHVVTLSEGNVFRFLYQVELDDEVFVWDQRDKLHRFKVQDVKLVPPTDVSVMEPTPDPTLTLITCGGTFDPVKREFSDRLIVTAKPASL
jgi:LPXTG-site transpeptidase (sortase) family protein